MTGHFSLVMTLLWPLLWPLLAVMLVAPPSQALSLGAEGRRCEYLFITVKQAPALESYPAYQTARVVGIESRARGEEFFRLRKINEAYPWGSNYAPKGYDRQGDPSTVFLVFGEHLAQVLGFRYEGRDLISPTPETINRRIARFNKFLVANGIAPIPVGFYSQPKALKETFVRHWYNELRIPVANDLSAHTIHDIAHHYAAILLPEAMTKLLQAQAGIVWHWMKSPLAKLLPQISGEAVARIDFISSSANFVPGGVTTAHFRFWGRYFADAEAPGKPARYRSPIDLFRERVIEGNFSRGSTEARPIIDNIEAKAEPFFAELGELNPKWQAKITSYGLIDQASVRELYINRSIELRYAARRFLEETPL